MNRAVFSRDWLGAAIVLAMMAFHPQAQAVDFFYDPDDGSLDFTSTNPLTTLELKSQAGHFVGTAPAEVEPPFGVFVPEKLFILNIGGLPLDVDLGPVLQTGLSAADLAADLCVQGSVLPNGLLDSPMLIGPDGPLPFTGCPPPPATNRYYLDHIQTTGELSLRYDGETPRALSTLMIESDTPVFDGPRPTSFDGPFDIARPELLFRLDTDGFTELELGPVTTPGESLPSAALCVAGSVLDGGPLPPIFYPDEFGRQLSVCDVAPPVNGGPGPDPGNGGGGGGGSGDIFIVYDPASGELFVDAVDSRLSTLEIRSDDGLFTGTPNPGVIQPPFDVAVPTKLFVLRTEGFESLEFGPVLAPGLSFDALDSLQVNGSILPNGGLGDVSFIVIPEPTTAPLMLMGLLLLGAMRRR